MSRKLEALAVIAVLVFIGLFIYTDIRMQANGEGADAWSGTDNGGSDLVTGSTGYVPWIENFWAPPSGEVESTLFSIQAAAGGIMLGLVFGYWYGERKGMQKARRSD